MNQIVMKLMNEKPLRIKEVAAILDVTPECVHNWRRQGKLPCVKIGGTYRILARHVEQYLKTGTVEN